jgi:hypothetical protein
MEDIKLLKEPQIAFISEKNQSGRTDAENKNPAERPKNDFSPKEPQNKEEYGGQEVHASVG